MGQDNKHTIHFSPGKHDMYIVYAHSNIDLGRLISKYIGETEKNLLLVDQNTEKYCLPVIREQFPNLKEEQIIRIKDGEDQKNVNSLEQIWTSLQEKGAERNTTLLNLGGGMLSDLGGFAASTFKRGISYVNIPTSLIGMVDAAIGGKTGINIGAVKNQAGCFALPEEVIIYPHFLHTLPWEELLSGYAEVIKTALISDGELFRKINKIKIDPSAPQAFINTISQSLIEKVSSIKYSITRKDPLDTNIRQCLNFGHTAGHAIESLLLERGHPIPHGHAVAIGMIIETFLSVDMMQLEKEGAHDIIDLITAIYPLVKLTKDDINPLLELMYHDKKNDNGIRMSLLRSIGNCAFGIKCEEDMVRKSIINYIHLA